MSAIQIKCGNVGDAYIGKTSFITRLIGQEPHYAYIPTVFDNRQTIVKYKDQNYELIFIEVADQEDYDRLRRNLYQKANVDSFLFYFSIDSEQSLDNIEKRWLTQMSEFSTRCNILIGTKCDLRKNGDSKNTFHSYLEKPLVKISRAAQFAKKHKMIYLEGSSTHQINIKEIHHAIIEAYRKKQSKRRS